MPRRSAIDVDGPTLRDELVVQGAANDVMR